MPRSLPWSRAARSSGRTDAAGVSPAPRSTPRRSTPRRFALPVAALAALGMVAACSGPPKGDGSQKGASFKLSAAPRRRG